MAVYEQGSSPLSGAARAGILANYAGAAVSCALIVGVAIWGYKLVVRDVSGIPVVRAMTGEMRILPENPGGTVSTNLGLAVNEVAAQGEAAAPEDSVALAPVTVGLAAEDYEIQSDAEAGEVAALDLPEEEARDDMLTPVVLSAEQLVNAPLSADDILALADQIAAGAQPLTDVSTIAVVSPTPTAPEVGAIASSVDVSRRPVARPSSIVVTASVAAAIAAPVASSPAVQSPVSQAEFAVGTKLVQLGAFPSAEVAVAEWTRLTGRFGDVMSGKSRVIQSATSGGKAFYRLRAEGFAELNDARRFCATMVAENVDCIPVVVR
tara:strand:- start:6827 stop:7792 length:966 start_codon:yes stop_codon:yes gene_type:complete